MSDNIVDSLNIEVSASIGEAIKSFEQLSKSMRKIKKITDDVDGMQKIASSIIGFANSVNKAIFKIERLANALEKLKHNYSAMSDVARAAGKAVESMNQKMPKTPAVSVPQVVDLGEVEEKVKEVEVQQLKPTKELDETNKNLEKVHKSSKKAAGALGHLASAFKRIVLYRALRAVISGLSKAFREGADNVYKYSRAIGSLDSNNTQRNLDAMASTMAKIKNTFGVTAVSVIDALRPVFDRLAASIINAANALNQFIAAMDGKSTYTVATTVVKQYAEETEKAAKASSKMLANFDELNNISLPGDSGSTSPSNTNYGEMFVERPIDKAVVDRFKDILETAEKIALVIAAWKITDSLVNWGQVFNFRDAEGHVTELGKKVNKALASAAIIAVSFVLTTQSFTNLLSGQGSFGDVLVAGLSTAAAGFGLFKLLGTTGLILEGVSLAVSFVWGSIKAAEIRFKNTELYQRLDELQKRAEKAIETTTEVKMNIEARLERVSMAGETYNGVEAMIDKLFAINGKEVLSDIDLKTIAAYVDTINGLNIDGLHLDLDPDGRVHQTYLEIKDIVKNLKKEMKVNAVREQMTSAYKDLVKLSLDGDGIKKDYADAFNIYSQLLAKYTNQKNYYDKAIEDIVKSSGTDEIGMNIALSQLYASKGWNDYQDTKKYLKKAKETFATAKQSMNEYNEAMVGIQNEINSYEKMLVDFSDNVGDAFDNVGNKAGNAGNRIKKVIDELKELPAKKKIDLDLNVNGNFRGTGGGVKNISLNVDKLMASGGFPSAGEVFIAREAGPEMVGTIGGRTAVANNQQIVEAISQGVYRAMTSAGGNTNVNVVLEGDAKKLFRAVQSESYNYTRSTGRPAFT